MNERTDGARWRAGVTAAFLVVAGGVMGVLVDRLWLSPPEVEATPLTAGAMAAHLGLSSAEAAHVRAILDTLHAEMLGAVQEGPDSLRTAVRDAQRRIEAALPPDARSVFRAWMQQHHEHMIGRLHGGAMDPRRMHGGAPGGAHSGDPDPRP